MSLVERRYAEALINISVQTGSVDEYQSEFRSIVEVYRQEGDFQYFLHNPEIGTETKKDVVKTIFTNKVRTELINFLMLLLDKGRIKLLPGILDEFGKLADKKRSILNMKIISAVPLDDKQINEIKEKYKKIYNTSEAKVDFEIDKSLVGGVRVQVGDKVTDGSVKGRLESLKAVLLK